VNGRLSPWANPLTGATGWQVLTNAQCIAVAMAGDNGSVRSHGDGQWHARIPEPSLTVAVTGADESTLWCHPARLTGCAVLAVEFTPWTPLAVLKCPVTALPASGTLSVRDVRITTRMGRTVRYLIPQFTPT
jgi:hypothetical protein